VRADAPPPVDLEWQVEGVGCPTRDAVLGRVRQLVGSDAASSPRIHGSAVMTRNERGLSLVVRVRSGDVEDTRTAESRSCAALGEAAAIILATAIDAARERQEAHDSPSIVADGPATPPARDDSRSTKPPPPGRSRREHRPPTQKTTTKIAVGVGASALFDFGTLPRPTAGIELAVHLGVDRWRVAIAGSLWQPREQTFTERSPRGARFEVLTLGGLGCWTPLGDRFRVGACAELDITRLQISGFGIRRPSSTRGIWPTVRAGLIAEARLHRAASVFIRTDAAFALAVPRIVLSTVGDAVSLHEVGSPAFHLTIGGRADVF